MCLIFCTVKKNLFFSADINGSPNAKFQENLSRKSEIFHAEREEKTKNRRDEANSQFYATLRTLLKCVLRTLCRLEEQTAPAECAVEAAFWEGF